jgi:hypothetical protein
MYQFSENLNTNDKLKKRYIYIYIYIYTYIKKENGELVRLAPDSGSTYKQIGATSFGELVRLAPDSGSTHNIPKYVHSQSNSKSQRKIMVKKLKKMFELMDDPGWLLQGCKSCAQCVSLCEIILVDLFKVK